jgi:ribosomal protein S18 acetylase RimI-like enzyme
MIRFRSARPEDDIVALIYESSRSLLDYNYGFAAYDPRAFLRRDYLRGRGFFGYEHQVVGVADSRIVATITAYPGRMVRRLAFASTRSVLGHFSPLRAAIVLKRALSIAGLFAAPSQDALFLANACVAQEFRRRGIFSALLDHLARERHLPAMELDVSFSNASAQRLYETLGFKVVSERPYHGDLPLDGFRRMRKELR